MSDTTASALVTSISRSKGRKICACVSEAGRGRGGGWAYLIRLNQAVLSLHCNASLQLAKERPRGDPELLCPLG